MNSQNRPCRDCESAPELSRRQFFRTSAAAALAAGALPLAAEAAPTPKSTSETLVKTLYDSLKEEQKKKMCFAWDYLEKEPQGKNPPRGLLRTHVSNNWQITPFKITTADSIYTKDQQKMIQDIFKGLTNPEWHDRFMKQLKDDSKKAWGMEQSIAIFGTPGTEKFELVLTGRHQTLRADGHSQNHVAFGGPIFYGHAAEDFNEKADHPGNVFWPQAKAANGVYKMLDSKQQKQALLEKSPANRLSASRGAARAARSPGCP